MFIMVLFFFNRRSIVVIVLCQDTMYPLWILWAHAQITMIHILFRQPSFATCANGVVYNKISEGSHFDKLGLQNWVAQCPPHEAVEGCDGPFRMIKAQSSYCSGDGNFRATVV
jgi:hypothetical protein